MNMNQFILSFLLFGHGILALPASPIDDCNHNGFIPIDYCYEEHQHNDILSSKSMQCEQVNDKWYVQEITYLNSNDCSGDNILIGELKECLAEQGCICGPESNDCIDATHQKLFYLVNGIYNEENNICEYNEFDAFVLYSYDEEIGVDCSLSDNNDYIERTDTCQRIYCNADGLIINNKRRRRRLFIFSIIFGTATGWISFCGSAAATNHCSTMSNWMCAHCW